ncbi:hypothetical protein [Parapedobacter koreensis]|uniref:DUF748 domain-containing protein n=1 Tax=Parapedobacter koreensis TaxID=332977 RepID=A0A1H7T822_9SPHI|nr:hypothetical protein [Parapedobacter koreensis]SEL79967.1 hypothetical protein SAMN05421740_11097 [Parapedobacter koreensis]
MKPIWKWVIGIVVSLLMIIAVGVWYLSRHWRPILDARLKEAVMNATDSLYLIAYDELDFNLITGNASIKNFRLTVDTTMYAKLEHRQQAPDNVYNINIANLRVRQFHPRGILSDRRLRIDDIIIDTPAIQVINTYHAYNDTVATKRDQRSLYQRIAHILNEVSVGDIHFNDIQFKFSKRTDSAVNETALNHLNVRVRDVLIDSVSQFDTTRFYLTQAIDVDMPGFRYETPDSFYYVSFDRLQLATSYRQLLIKGLKYAPRMNRREFYRRSQQAKDMAIIAFPTIRLEDVDLQRFVDSRQLYAGSLHIDSGTVAISNDLRYPKHPTNKIGKSPHQLLLKMKQVIKIDSVLLNHLSVSYAEVSKKYGKEGKITFDNASGVFRNVTNDTSALLKNQVMEAQLTAYLMNTGKLDVLFAFDMLDKRGGYTYKGTVGPMNGMPFNRIITPLLNAEIGSANIKGLNFDVQADDHRARGSLRFDYDNMRLHLLSADDDGNTSSNKVVSFLTNSFIINDSNPDANGQYHRGRINYTRPETYSFFKMLWQSLLQGIKESAGISPEREQRLMNTAEEAKRAAEKTGGFFRRVFGKKGEGEKNQD